MFRIITIINYAVYQRQNCTKINLIEAKFAKNFPGGNAPKPPSPTHNPLNLPHQTSPNQPPPPITKQPTTPPQT